MKYPALTVLMLAVVFMCGCGGPATIVVGLEPGGRHLTATPIARDGQLGSRRIVVVDVSGVLVNAEESGLLSAGYNPVASLAEALDAAAADPSVAAVVLRINSPGGTVTASDMMYREVMRFRQQTGKPVVACLMDLATSGGYYLACAADIIVAYPTTVTGSIGVVLQTFSLAGALQKLGIDAEALVSGPNKTAGSPFEELEPPQRQTLQALVDTFYAQFVDVVKTARPGVAADDWEALTDGRVISGRAALDRGLVDAVGDVRDAIALAKARAGLSHADVWSYHRPLDYVATPYARGNTALPAAASGSQINLLQFNLGSGHAGLTTGGPGFYYLWRPGLD